MKKREKKNGKKKVVQFTFDLEVLNIGEKWTLFSNKHVAVRLFFRFFSQKRGHRNQGGNGKHSRDISGSNDDGDRHEEFKRPRMNWTNEVVLPNVLPFLNNRERTNLGRVNKEHRDFVEAYSSQHLHVSAE